MACLQEQEGAQGQGGRKGGQGGEGRGQAGGGGGRGRGIRASRDITSTKYVLICHVNTVNFDLTARCRSITVF